MTHMVKGSPGLSRRSGDSEGGDLVTTVIGTEVKILFNYYSLIGIV